MSRCDVVIICAGEQLAPFFVWHIACLMCTGAWLGEFWVPVPVLSLPASAACVLTMRCDYKVLQTFPPAVAI